jgi:hypothetical protein
MLADTILQRTSLIKSMASAKPASPSDGPGAPAGTAPVSTVPALPRGAVKIGTAGGKTVYQAPDGKKFIAD